MKNLKSCWITSWTSVVTFLCFAVLAGPNSVSAGLAVSGTIKLPAPATGDVEIDVYLEDTESLSYTAQLYTLSDGQDSQAYSLETTVFNNGRIRYVCLSNCGEIYPAGYVTDTGTSYRYEDARIFTANFSAININLPLGFRVGGEVKLPLPETAAAPIGLEVIASQTDYYWDETQYIIIPSGGTSATYSLLLPPDPSGLWTVNYYITPSDHTQYYHTGYYGTPLSTTYISTNATKILGSTPYSNIDMTLLRGRTIEGTLSLPASRVAPVGGLEITMRSYNIKYYGGEDSATVVIPEGGSSGDYSLVFPWDEYNSWYVDYGCGGYDYSTCIEEGYLPMGYYAGASEPTFYVWREGYGALWGAQSHAGIDLSLIPAKRIGGEVALPEPAPAGGLWLTVYADDPVNPGAMSDDIYIAAGAGSASYEVAIPEDTTLNWRVFHKFDDSTRGYIKTAYFTTSGTSHLVNEATMLNGGTDHYHIDMTALLDKDNDGIPDTIDDDIRVPTVPIGAIMLLLRSTP